MTFSLLSQGLRGHRWPWMVIVCGLAVLGGIGATSQPATQATHLLSGTPEKPATQRTVKRQKAGVTSAPWWRDAVFYQIFVRSFQDSDGDGIGDLQGIIQRLDQLKALPRAASSPHAVTSPGVTTRPTSHPHVPLRTKSTALGGASFGHPLSRPSSRPGTHLGDVAGASQTQSLGVNALWLTPIFASPSYHGYDVTDYRKIHPLYGNHKIFLGLLREAKRRGIRVILDLMVNHTSNQHPWFLRASKSTNAQERDWYVWRRRNPGWRQPWGNGPVWHPMGRSFYYGIFWKGMPDLNLAHPPARQAIFSIARYWLQQGVDGLRLDAARHLFADGPRQLQNDRPATHRFWRDFRRQTKAVSSEALLVGEVWSKAGIIQRYCRGDQFDLAFHFPLGKAIKLAVSAMEVAPLWKVLQHPLPASCWATFLANHDQTRILTQLAGNQSMMRAAAFVLLTLPGTPFLYYGEEIGMPNGTRQRGDPAKRTPMAWDASRWGGFSTHRPWTPLAAHQQANVATQRQTPGSLWHHYRRLIQLRHRYKALRHGKIQRVAVMGKGSDAILAFVRSTGEQRLLVLRNLNDLSASGLRLHLPVSTRSNKAPRLLYQEGRIGHQRDPKTGTRRLDIGANAAAVFAL